MPSDTITLALNGDVPFQAFAEAITRWRSLIDALSEELGVSHDIEWLMHDLQVGSTMATIRGEAERPEQVERVVRAYASVGKTLERRERLAFSPTVVRSAQALTRILSDKVTTIRFETPEEEAIISAPGKVIGVPLQTAYGAVEGRVQTLTSRKGLRFILYDTLHDRAVSCYLQEGKEDLMREAWDRRAIVEGLVIRDTLIGYPIAVRQVTQVKVLPEIEPGGYLAARGLLPVGPDEPPPEELIRQMRDA